MEIIPVIDIHQGQAVHAIEGQRQHYRPLRTSLGESNSPENIVQAFINTYPFKTIYIADLDAIEGQSNNNRLIDELHKSYQSLTFWVDKGISTTLDLDNLSRRQHVIGSESNITPEKLGEMIAFRPDIILSLDFKKNTFLGNQDLLIKTDLWPERIIIMSLANVGANKGPDYELISKLKKTAGERKIFVAGGVRDETDLLLLNKMNIDGVLMATALHTQKIKSETLSKFS